MHLTLTHVLKNPIVLVSISMALLGWLLAFVGACILGSAAGGFWWTLIYNLLILLGLGFTVFKTVFHHYQLTFFTLLGISISLLTTHVNGLINQNGGGHQVAGAGAVILIVMQFFWIILFGNEESGLFKYIYADVPQLSPKESKVALSSPSPTPSTLSPPKIMATALHPYQANQEDPNELSFSKDEVVEILNKSGNWWQAKKSDGTIGIVPSNYFSNE
ncbi:hypothetical protein BDB01DRAFT_853127 [Pilobolus umbonatus]|nr:hypothetical protein BDB01DRAFT_853127 [Pilobolus umbonatus]